MLTGIEGLLGGEAHLGGAMAIMAGVMMPLAFLVISLALRPYAGEMIARRQAGLI